MRYMKSWHLSGELREPVKLDFGSQTLTIEPGVEVTITVTTLAPIEETPREQDAIQ